VAVRGPRMAVVSGGCGGEDMLGPGNTALAIATLAFIVNLAYLANLANLAS